LPSPRETILAALHSRLSALPAAALRGEVLPERVTAEGLLRRERDPERPTSRPDLWNGLDRSAV